LYATCRRDAAPSAINVQRRNTHVKPSRLLVGALLTVATACGDSTGPGGLNGRVSFSYSGATSGTFDASGSILEGDPLRSTWAAGARDDENESLAVAANLARSETTTDDVVIDFPQLATGTVTVANGARVAISFGYTQTGIPTWSCDLTSGSVTVTTLSGTRARGSFSGTGTCVNSNGTSGAFTVSNGSFDVPVVNGF
jgi:hypothetical protein